jgi:hypothetical protein
MPMPHPPVPAIVAQCRAADLKLSTGGDPGDFNGMSHSGTLLIVRNVGRRTCSVPGLPVLTFRISSGAAPIRRNVPPGMHPGPVVLPVRLAPGAVASTPLRWVSGTVFDKTLCYDVLNVWTLGVHAKLKATICGPAAQPAGIDQPPLGPGMATGR